MLVGNASRRWADRTCPRWMMFRCEGGEVARTLPRDTRRDWRRPRGAALVLSLLLLALLLMFAIGFLQMALTESGITTNSTRQVHAFYAAEAGLESGYRDLRTVLLGAPSPTGTQLQGIGPRSLTEPVLAAALTVSVAVQRGNPPGAEPYRTTIESGPFRGLFANVTDYAITSAASDASRGITVQLAQAVRYLRIPLFQFGAFYGRGIDFETYAGPTFTFTGRVHGDSDVYISDTSVNGLSFDSYVTATGGFYRRRKDSATTVRAGNPQVRDAGGAYRPLDFDREVKNISGDGSRAEAGGLDYWRSEANRRFGGRVLDGAHGVQEIIPPIPALLTGQDAPPDVLAHQMIERGSGSESDALREAMMYDKADLRILDGEATNKRGESVDLTPCAEGTLSVARFHDGRERKEMAVRELDLGKLLACGKMPANGVLYIADTGSSAAVRLVNGQELPAGGLTIASENPVYIQGNYNTRNKRAAAVMADAVTILSENWRSNGSDDKGDRPTSQRRASDTIVNAAIATGPSEESSPGAGNGEFNNVLRFLEDWSRATFTYSGSVVVLWHSQQARERWRCCGAGGDNYYDPPTRVWSYDTLFDTTQPPGTPYGVHIARGQWSGR